MARQNEIDNYSQWRPGDRKGLYESYFLRGNCLHEPRAFWIKFTVFAPKDRPKDAEGELWAIYFAGADGEKTAVKETHPLRTSLFAADRFDVRVGRAHLANGVCAGSCASGDHAIEWTLGYPTSGPSLHFLPEWAYRAPFPKAKGLAPYPDLTWEGTLRVDGKTIDVTGWRGSQNHNWGEKHTDQYAWAQCNTFIDCPDTYMEMMSARLKVGPVWTPYINFLVLQYRGERIRFNDPRAILKSRVRFPARFEWHLSVDNGKWQANCMVAGKRETFAGLRYRNPPGGEHACLNSKISSAEILLLQKGREVEHLRSDFTTAFELLTDETNHGVPLLV